MSGNFQPYCKLCDSFGHWSRDCPVLIPAKGPTKTKVKAKKKRKVKSN